MSQKNLKKIIFIALFVLLGFGAMQVPFSQIIGSDLKFNLFDFYGPIVGGFIGSVLGLITVVIMQLVNWAWHGFATDTSTLIRFLPMLCAVLYFAKKSSFTLLIPVIAMIAFWIHPEGRQAWYYAFYWLIPITTYFLHDKYLIARALGTTFTAHCVGSVLFLYAMNLKAAVWIGLIPIVWKERMLMAVGIMVTFIVFNFIMSLVMNKFHIKLPFVKLNPKYSFGYKAN